MLKVNKKIRGIFAAVSAVLLCGNAITATAHAPYNDFSKVILTEGGLPNRYVSDFYSTQFHNLNWRRHYDFLAITTAEGLEDNITADDSAIDIVIEWDEYKESLTNPENPTTISPILSDYVSLHEKYGEDSRIYYVRCNHDTEDMYTVARRFALEHDSVLTTEMLEMRTRGKCEWTGTFSMIFTAEMGAQIKSGELTEENLREMFPLAYEKMDSLGRRYEEYKVKYAEWEAEFSKTEAEMIAQDCDESDIRRAKSKSLSEAGLSRYTSWTGTAIAGATDVYEEYKDTLAGFEPNFEVLSFGAEYHTYDAWEELGDVNEDGFIDASDAAEILNMSAMMGINTASTSKWENQFADINADGIPDASDASLLLAYSAALGSGETVECLNTYMLDKLKEN